MSERRRELVTNAVAYEGSVERFAVKADVSPSMIRSILKDGYVPKPRNVKKIALAGGLQEDGASALAYAAFEGARETA